MSVLATARPAAGPPQVTRGDLYLAFLQVSLSGFGGALAWTRRKFVERLRWLSPEEFTEVLSFCQFLPGPNIINLAVFLGLRFQGTAGAVVAVAGVIVVPFAVVLTLGVLYTHFGHIELVHGALAGVSAAAGGLVLSMGVKMGMVYRDRPGAMAVAGLACLGAGLMQWPLPIVLLVLAPPSLALSWFSWMRRR